MAQADSGRAIGAVTNLLHEHLTRRGFVVDVGRPESAPGAGTGPKLNLFLYEARVDGSLRNVPLQPDAAPPLWLVLKYLLTAFDATELSDSSDAHELLGRGLSALQELNFLSLDAQVKADIRSALENSPEPLKVTFDESPADLLSKIMQGSDESYRLSMAFEVRPVMILAGEPPTMAPLVGVDSSPPPTIIGGEAVGLTVLPSLGPSLERVTPAAFEPDDEIALYGEELHLGGLECWLGPVELSIVGQRPDRLTVRVEGEVHAPATEGPIRGGTAISPGEHPIRVRQPLANLRARSSNLLIGRLRPVVTTAHVSAAGTLTVDGILLGTWEDDLLVALRQDGAIARMFEAGPQPPPASPARTVVPDDAQRQLTVTGLKGPKGVAPGDYQVLVRVNGQQARLSPTVMVA